MATKKVKASEVKKMNDFMPILAKTENGFKLSFRSNGIDVADICMLFGGGGHKMAAGCTIDAPLDEVKKAVIEETKKHL